MTIHELFEQRYADDNGFVLSAIQISKGRDGQYENPWIERCFRMFKAGFEADQAQEMQLLGFVSQNNAEKMIGGKMHSVRAEQAETHPVAVYARQCEPLKPAGNA